MRHHKLDLNLLVALEALLDTQSVTRAASRLHISQAAMSNALARLRAHFDDPLLVRVGRHMMMTERARAVQADVRDILRRVETRVLAPQAFDPAVQARRFVIHAADAAVIGDLADLGRRVARMAPGVELILRNLTDESTDALHRGEADLLLVPRQFAYAEHRSQVVTTEPFQVVVWSGSPHATATLTARDYLDAEHVVVELGENRRSTIDRAIIEHAHGKVRSVISVPSQALVPWHVIGTNRLGTLPASLVATYCGALPLVSRALPIAIPPLVLALQWNRHADDDAALTWLRQVMVELMTHSPS